MKVGKGGEKLFYVQQCGTIVQTDCIPKERAAVIGMFHEQQWEEVAKKFQIVYSPFQEISKYAYYECLDGFDFISINTIDYQNLYGGQRRVLFYLKKDFYLIFSDEPAKWKKMMENSIALLGEKATVNRLFFDFFTKLIGSDISVFDGLEKEIAELEQALITSQKRDCVKEIISLRKRLMILKKYYEQILDVLEALEENENNIFDEKTVICWNRLGKKTERFYENVLNLREAVTQVRESYQAQVDINLNHIMRIFTVITTICLPLTLIVGWYGMNFDMPEYGWKHSYGMIIMLSVAVVSVSIIFFKKKGWF